MQDRIAVSRVQRYPETVCEQHVSQLRAVYLPVFFVKVGGYTMRNSRFAILPIPDIEGVRDT